MDSESDDDDGTEGGARLNEGSNDEDNE